MKKILVLSLLITLFLSGCEERVEVVFDSQGGSNVETKSIVFGETLKEPNSPVKEGYTFTGWYLSPEEELLYDFSLEIEDDIILYAQWDINQYTVTYKDWNETIVYEEILDFNSSLEHISIASILNREDYDFVGWDMELPDSMPAYDLVVEAVYTNEYVYELFDQEIKIIEYLGSDANLKIPYSLNGNVVAELGEGVFADKELVSVDIPAGVSKIGVNSFFGNKLESIKLPSNLVEIGSGAFAMNKIEEVILPDTLEGIGGFAFRNNSITKLELPQGISYISEYAFEYNQIETLVIPDSVVVIERNAFASNKLTSVTFGQSVVDIETEAFIYNSLTNIQFPERLNSIGTDAFSWNEVSSLEIPGSIMYIGNRAFDWSEIITLNIADNQFYVYQDGMLLSKDLSTLIAGVGPYTNFFIPDYVEKIGPNAFDRNYLKSITIADSVTTIGNMAFAFNDLTNINIPNSVTSIGYSAFWENQIESVTIPDSVMSIGNSAFYNNLITELHLGNNLVEIGLFAFHRNQLTSIEVPESVVIIGQDAFLDNDLQSITILGAQTRFNKEWENIGFPVELILDCSDDFIRITFEELNEKSSLYDLDSYNSIENYRLIVYYFDPDQSYSGWKVWTWVDDDDIIGYNVSFDSSAVVTSCSLEVQVVILEVESTDYEIGFIVKDGSWNKKFDGDIYIDVSDIDILNDKFIYYVAGYGEVFYDIESFNDAVSIILSDRVD